MVDPQIQIMIVSFNLGNWHYTLFDHGGNPRVTEFSLLNSQQEFIDDYMAKGKPNHETNGEEPDPEDMGINEDAQTQQDFEQFKAWLQETFGPAASVKRAASSSSLSDGESSVASSSKDGNPECVHPKPAITRRTPIEIATNNSGADSVNLCGSCGKTSCN